MSNKRAPLGVALIVVGLLIAYFANEKIHEYEKGVGFLKKTFSEEHSNKETAYKTARIGGIVVAVVGGLMVLGGTKS